MKQYFRWILSAGVMVLLFTFLPELAAAQPGPGCDPAIDPACVPIDGGLSLLIAAGIGYGVKKVKDSRKKQQAEQAL